MDLVLGHDKTIAEWAGKKLGVTIEPGYVAWGVIDRTGLLAGAFIFHNFVRGGNIEIGAVGPIIMKRGILREAARYVFIQLKCTRATALAARHNKRMQKLLIKAGFTFECTHREWFGPTRKNDALVFVLFPEQATRWIR